MYGFGKTDIGSLRAKNEDSIFFRNDAFGDLPNVFVISDGMGGHKAGDQASSKAIEFFCRYVEENSCDERDFLDYIIEAISYANEKVYDLSVSNEAFGGMGATFTVCVVSGDKIFIAHIGDSRVYGIRKDVITQLTTDHTYVNDLVKSGMLTKLQARSHPKKNIITRALGVEKDVIIDGIIINTDEFEYILACSDGLSGMITDEEIYEMSIEGVDIEQKIDNMIRLANQNGGYDNVSLILIDLKAPNTEVVK